MTDEQRKRIHDITYSTDDRMELAERIVALEAESADLKRQLRQADEIVGRQCKNLEKSNDENAKLRELVRDVHEALRADKAGMFHKLTLASVEDDMRELGIEVDE